MRKNYGIPYKGSKNKIAEDIIDFLPSGNTLVDLFGGGGAITDCASKSCKWEKIIYNEIDKLPHDCFIKALKGEFDNEERWISKEDFLKLKDTDCYAACCFSFGNDFKTYMYSKEIEPLKKKCHEAIMSNPEYIKARKEMKFGDMVKTRTPIQKELIGVRGKGVHPDCVEGMSNVENLERIQSLKTDYIDNIHFYNEDYRNIQIPDNSIIYCDIPYRNTNNYKKSIAFNYETFYQWCVDMSNKGYEVFISEYNIPDDRFEEVWCKEKRSAFNDKKSLKTIEKIYTVKKK